MKMGNIVPRVGLEPASLAFRASVLPLHHVGFPDGSTIPLPTCLCSSLPQRSVQTTTIVLITGETLRGVSFDRYAQINVAFSHFEYLIS